MGAERRAESHPSKMLLLSGQVGVILLVAGAVFGEPENEPTATPTPSPPAPPTFSKVSCTGKLANISNSDELYDELLPRVLSASDTESDVVMKKEFLKYLTLSATFASMINCTMATPLYHEPRWIQEDEDDEDGGGAPIAGGFVNAINTLASGMNNQNPLDNSNVLLGVRRILANVFTGNLVGIIQESVGLRSPEGVSTVFTDVLSTLFGSTATAGITGVIGNATSTVSPQNTTSPEDSAGPESYYQQVTQQQQYIQQLKEQGVLDQAQAIALHHTLLAQQSSVKGPDAQFIPQQQPRPQQQQHQQPRPQQQQQQFMKYQHPQRPQSPQSPAQPQPELQQYFQQSQLGQVNNVVIRRPVQPRPQQNIPASQPLKQQEEDNDYEDEE